uniref:Chromosome 11 open reading frame 53 n=1 Tax=Chinchilla lanigera TaxID=34839 RepID=A0A8C2VYQ9_CHILA
MPGSPVMSGYYGVRRSFLSDSDFHGSKPFGSDAYTPGVAKPFACEPAAAQGPAALLERDSWEQTVPDGFSQPDPVPAEALQTLPPSTSCLSPLESASTTQHRSASWGAPLAGTQPYSLHTLEDLHHPAGYPAPPPYPFAPLVTMSNDLLPKGLPLSPEEGTDTSSLHDPSPWTKEDGSMAWGAYECRRAY